jgi:multicomponent Na+:H+ antiporter subunit D
VVPGFAEQVARSMGEAASGGVPGPVHWTPHGILLGLLSSVLALGIAFLAVAWPRRPAARAHPLRRLQSGHVGDYVAWLLLGATVLGALSLPGVLDT